MMTTEQFREHFRKNMIPRWYSGWVHLVSTFLILGGVMGFALTRLQDPQPYEWGALIVILLLGNFVVYVVHRFPLHRPLWGMGLAFKIHAQWHHRFFTDDYMLYRDSRDFYILFFPTAVVVVVNLLVAPALAWIVGHYTTPNIGYCVLLGIPGYFLLYEIFHYCGHLPKDAIILKIPLLGYMRELHQIHHNPHHMAKHNFNIVYPLADSLFGTLYDGGQDKGKEESNAKESEKR